MGNPKFHFTYKVTFETGHFYIGKHTTSNLDDDYSGSGLRVSRMRERGYPFDFEIIEHFDSADKAFAAEKILLGDLWKTDNLCLNLKEGGEGGWSHIIQRGIKKSIEHKEKISQSNKKPKIGKSLVATVSNGLKGAEGRRGKKDSAETKAKRNAAVRAATLGVPKPNHKRGYVFKGVFYNSLEDVINDTGLSYYKILTRCQDENFQDSRVVKPSERKLHVSIN